MAAESTMHPVERELLAGLDAEEARMWEDSDSEGQRRRHPRRRSRRHSRRKRDPSYGDLSEAVGSIDEALLSDEERHYRAARRRAEQKVELSRKAFRAAIITLPLLIFLPFAGVIALVVFGIDLGRRAFQLFYEPQLRERFMNEEIQRRVQTHVVRERESLEGEQHRSLEQLSASIAHEIRNPITAAKSLVQQMGEHPDDADLAEYARVAVTELERVERSISHLLRFAREEETRSRPIVMEEVVESALETFRDRCARSGVRIERRFDASGELEGDAEQLRRVVINLVANAIDALEAARVESPEVEVSLGENLAGSEVWLRVADNGLGLDETTRERIFDPFFTSREQGTGLGLALCRKIVDRHGGTIEVDSEPGEGTRFVLSFPKTARGSGSGQTTGAGPQARTR